MKTNSMIIIGNVREIASVFLLFLGYLLGGQNMNNKYQVEFSEFEVFIENSKVIVRWTTVREKSTTAFVVQRSLDSKVWEDVISIPSLQNTSANNFYQIVDEYPYRTSSYYRIKCINFESYEKTTPDFWLESIATENSVQVYPNPATDFLTVTGESVELLNLHLYDMTGREIDLADRIFSVSELKIIINLRNLPLGIYFLRTKSFMKRIIKS